MLNTSSLEQLLHKKNLLAFSAGGDSTALFFLLLEHNINFDITIVDYSVREQSKEEVLYAQELARLHNLKCHILNATTIKNNFEAKAREIRYGFFEELIRKHNYENLLTAHHLGDRFEWMLMQFCKGAGCVELSGMQELEKKENYTLIRPLLGVDKQELLVYLNSNAIKYFEDETNNDESFKRNQFRHLHSQPLLQTYLLGIKKSFEYIDEDRKNLIENIDIKSIGEFSYFENIYTIRSTIFSIDKYLKTKHHMITAQERELLKTEKTLIVGRKFIINQNNKFVFIAPYISDDIVMTSDFKDECRKLKIEPKLRKYLFLNQDVFLKLKSFI